MKYGMYYNYYGVGDVLLIKFSEDTPNKVVKVNDVVALYKDEKLVGYNVFSLKKVMKIKTTGLILNPPHEFMDVVNNILKNAGFAELPMQNTSGFVVGYIENAEKLKDSDHLSLCKVRVNEDEVLQIVCGASNCAAHKKVVVATDNTFMFDGTIIKSGELRGIKSEGMLCSSKELNFPPEKQSPGILILPDNSIVGSDVFK